MSGPPLQWPAWVMDISPFTHTPKLPGGAVPAEPLLWLGGITLALVVAGLTGLRHRDIGDFGPSRLSCLVRDWIVGDPHQTNELPPAGRGPRHGTATRDNRPGHAITATAPGAQNRLICADECTPAKPRESTPIRLSLKDIQGGATALTLRDVSAWLLVRCHCRNARLAIRLLWAVLFAAVREAIGSPAWLPGVNTAAKIHS